MDTFQAKNVFLSYAHLDGTELVQRLRDDLSVEGYPVWLDKQRLTGGDSWSNEIEQAIDSAGIVIALLSHGSYVSEICRGEQLRSLRKGKCVIPLKVQKDCDVPIYLEAKQWLDFSARNLYDQERLKLIAAMENRIGAVLKSEYRTTFNNAPGLPENLVRRPETLKVLRDCLFAQGAHRNIALTALHGMGGIGKTVLAQELCHDDVVQQAFPDGVFWFTIGQESRTDFGSRIKGVPGLNRLLGEYEGEEACISQYRDVLQKKAMLIVLDDVWHANDIKRFYAESPRSRLLFTTRDVSIAASFGAREFKAELLTEAQSEEVLTLWSGWKTKPLPPSAKEIVQECGRLPLALSMIGASLRGEPSASWTDVADHLRQADLSLIEGEVATYQHTSFLRAIQVSLEALEVKTPQDKERYLALAVLPEDMEVPVQILRVLWGLDEFETRRVAKRLVELSLAQRDSAERGIRLHDLQLDYLRRQHDDQKALSLLVGAMRLSAHVIDKDPVQFSSQMIGRLLLHQYIPAIGQFIAKTADRTGTPWFRPLQAALNVPGTSLQRTLAGHSSVVTTVALSADGRLAVSASWDKTLKVWDAVSGRELHTLTGHTGPLYAVALTADGTVAVSASGDTLKVWDVDSGRELHTVEGLTQMDSAIGLSADGRVAVSASGNHTLKVWEVSSGRELRTLAGNSKGVSAIALSADGKLAVSASDDHTLTIWDVSSARELHTLVGHTEEVSAVAITADGRLAVSASWDNTLKVWDMVSGRELHTLVGHTGRIRAVVVTPDGRKSVSASDDATLKVWEVSSGCELHTLVGHTHQVRAVALAAGGQLAVSASWDNTLKVWDVDSGRELQTLAGHSSSVNAVALTPDGRRAVSASWDTTLKVWELGRGLGMPTLAGHSDEVRAVALTTDQKLAVSASLDKMLKVWDVENGRELHTLVGHTDAVKAVAVTAGQRLAVSASDDKTLKVWDLDSGRELHTLAGHTGGVCAIALTADGRLAVSASGDHTLKVWEMSSGRELRTLVGHTGQVYAVALTADARLAVSASGDHTLKVWEVSSGRELRTLAGHTDDVKVVALSADGKLAVSGSQDRTVKIWDVDSGRQLHSLDGYGGSINAVVLTSDGRFAVSASDDWTVRVLDVANGRQLHMLLHKYRVSALALTADGKMVVSASSDNTLKMWDVSSGLLLATFTCDGSALCCTSSGSHIAAGDMGGHVHLIRVEL
jgi:WD40 repeat protein